MAFISIVTPVYKTAAFIDELYIRSKSTLELISTDFEIIFVNDGSPDDAWERISKLAESDNRIKGINLSRNFGQHIAITAGLDNANSEWVVVMDCDLQDRPEEILNLYNKAKEGVDIVLARRKNRKDTFLKKVSSYIFHHTLSYLIGARLDNTVGNFGIYHKKVIKAIISMREPIRYFPTMVNWVGFKSCKIDVTHDHRYEGHSSYNFSRLIKLAIDIILANSDKPIKLLIKLGLLVSAFSLVLAILFIIRWVRGEIDIFGYRSMVVSIWFLSGIMISTLGLIGLYVGKTFEGVKNRPIYIIEKMTP